MAKKFMVIGMGVFGTAIAENLMHEGAEVLAVDINAELINSQGSGKYTDAKPLDTTSEESIKQLGLDQIDCAIVCLTDLKASVLTSLLLKQEDIPELYARATDEAHAEILRKIGVENVLQPEKSMAARLAKELTNAQIIELLSVGGENSSAEDRHPMIEIRANERMIGKTIRQLDLRRKYQINIVAFSQLQAKMDENGVKEFTYTMNDVPDPDQIIGENDKLYIVGSQKHLTVFREDYLL